MERIQTTKTFFKKAALGALLMVFACAVGLTGYRYADAQDRQEVVEYNAYYDISDPDYRIAYYAMQPMLEGKTDPYAYPMIDIAKFDVTNDGFPEIIATPMDGPIDEHFHSEPEHSFSDDYMFCNKLYSCPHYILQKKGRKVLNLGIIYAYSLTYHPSIANGYKRIAAYKSPDYKEYDLYEFNPQIGKYVLAP